MAVLALKPKPQLPNCRHSNNGMLSPVDYEMKYDMNTQGV